MVVSHHFRLQTVHRIRGVKCGRYARATYVDVFAVKFNVGDVFHLQASHCFRWGQLKEEVLERQVHSGLSEHLESMESPYESQMVLHPGHNLCRSPCGFMHPIICAARD